MPNERILDIVVKHISNFKRRKIVLRQDVLFPVESASIGHEATRHRSAVMDCHVRASTVGNETVMPHNRACGTGGALRFNLFPFRVDVKQFTDVYFQYQRYQSGLFYACRGDTTYIRLPVWHRPARPRTRRHRVNQRTSKGHRGAMR